MHDGWAKVLTKAGFEILHSHSTAGTFFDNKDSVRTTFLKEGKPVLVLEQNFDRRGGSSLSEIYRVAAIKLGLHTPKDPCPEGPIDLDVIKTNEGNHMEDTVFRHPSFGTVTLGKYSGRDKHFMSPIETMGGMVIRVHSADLHLSTSLGTENVFTRDILFEFKMSFTQFAEFITSHGQGSGVPCTIGYDGTTHIQQFDLPTRKERAEEHVRATMNATVADIQSVLDEVDAEMSGPGSLPAGRKKELWQKIKYGLRGITSKPQFLLKLWTEHVDETMSHAKGEFSQWVNDRAAGQQALTTGEAKQPDPLSQNAGESE